MNCPQCDQQAITFFDWAKGLQWWKTNCRSCEVGLKANAVTWIGFVVSVVLGIVVVWGVAAQSPKTSGRWSIPLASGLIVVGVGGIITWFVGGYDIDARRRSPPHD